MTALISAELLRIRTLRVTRYVVIGMLGLAVLLAVFPPSGPRSAFVDSVRSVTFTFVMAAAYIAATQLGTEFKRGTAALTYLTHPNRRTVATARVLTYGLIGGLLAALAAIVALAAGVMAAHLQASPTDIGAQSFAGVIGGAAFGGAALGGFGALVGTITREPILATVAVVIPPLIAAPLPAVSPYLPFGLADQLLGGADKVAAPPSDDPAARLCGCGCGGRPPMGAPTRPSVSNSVSPGSTAPAVPLETNALRRSYGRLIALQGLSLAVAAGDCVALIGANGSGKTTAVRAIAGLLEPSGGVVRVCGWDPHREPEAERARAALALVVDSPLLYDDLTVRQHLELVTLSHGAAGEGVEERVSSLLLRLGLHGREGFLPGELSRGMRQKTQLACALVRPAAVLVLDEPVVGLDPPSQTLLHRLLVEAKQAGAAILLTTHQMAFADGLADRGVLLQDGTVVDEGPWAQVRERAERRGWH